MLGKMVRKLEEVWGLDFENKAPVMNNSDLAGEKIPEWPDKARAVQPKVRDANSIMNWYFQKGYPYPKNTASFS
ncbi:MAG: hypothetical protein HQK96_18510 [Nitrospirae bacterium]|nr:hypothetical protein [Nitrospirota bacterium]